MTGRQGAGRRFALVALAAVVLLVGLVVIKGHGRERDATPAATVSSAAPVVVPPSPTTTTALALGPESHDQPTPTLSGGTVYADTSARIPTWPVLSSSEVVGGNIDGYGMSVCAGGSWTKAMLLQTTLENVEPVEHAYEGTLRTTIELRAARASSNASCASMSTGIEYAVCEMRLDGSSADDHVNPADTAGRSGPAATQVPLSPPDTITAPAERGTLWLPASRPDAPQLFSAGIAASSDPASVFVDGSTTVRVVAGATAAGGMSFDATCFEIVVSSATASGCLSPDLLATGLAYGEFQDRGGSIDVIGIVPDDIGSVEIDGHTIEVSHNVWHYVGAVGADLTFTVRSVDGSRSASIV